jgi:hypothetical protein
MNKRFLLVLADKGIYLGHEGGQYFWSYDLTTGDLPQYAIAFRSQQEIQGFLLKEFGQEFLFSEVPAFPIECERTQHASVGECAKAGFPIWNFLAENFLPC